jgi:hypothetical protein
MALTFINVETALMGSGTVLNVLVLILAKFPESPQTNITIVTLKEITYVLVPDQPYTLCLF